MNEIAWYTSAEIGWYTISEIGWYSLSEIGHLLIILVKWYSDRYWKNTVKGIERIDKRLERIEEQLEGMDRTILDYGERLDGVAMFVEGFEEREQEAKPQDPLEAIVKEQRQIGR